MNSNIEQQLDELEFLQSMFSAPGEFKIEDQSSYQQAVDYTQRCAVVPIPKALSCSLHIPINAHQDSEDEADEADDNMDVNNEAEEARAVAASGMSFQYNVDISIRIPNSYPDTLPEVYVSSNELSRKSQDDLNSDLQQFISTSLSPGEVALLNIVEWIRDNAGTFFPISASSNDALEQESDQTKEDSGPGANFCRMWLYMHHIYSKTKRRNILAHADELQLTGFCLPGKPGIVCVEGSSQNTKDFYSTLRRWNWKSIACRRKEMVESKDLDSNRRIRGFAELAFDTHGSRQTHMDMGQFLEYLKRHKLEYMFKELFGVEGHID